MTHDPYGTDPRRPHAGPDADAGAHSGGWMWGAAGLVAVLVIIGLVMSGGSVNEGEQTASSDRVSPPAAAPATPGAGSTGGIATPPPNCETVGGR